MRPDELWRGPEGWRGVGQEEEWQKWVFCNLKCGLHNRSKGATSIDLFASL